MSVSLSTDLTNPSAIPYFLWDEPLTVAEFRRRLTTSAPAEQIRLLAKLLREARGADVWKAPRLKRYGENGPISLSILGGVVNFGSFFWIAGRKRAFWRCLNRIIEAIPR